MKVDPWAHQRFSSGFASPILNDVSFDQGDFSYRCVKDELTVHDLHATILHQLGIDHEQLTYIFQGRRYRLTDVEGHIVKPILA